MPNSSLAQVTLQVGYESISPNCGGSWECSCGLGIAPAYLYLENLSSFTISIEQYFLYNFVYSIYFYTCAGYSLLCGLCLAGVSRGNSLVGGAWAFVAEHVLQGAQASVTVAHWLSCSAACGILLDQGSNPCLPHWQVNFSPLNHQRSR